MASASTVTPSVTASQKSGASTGPAALDRASARYKAAQSRYRQAKAALKAVKRQIVPVDAFGNRKPRLRGWLHLATLPLCIAASIVLICIAPAGPVKAACAVYGASAMLLFGNSALRTPNWVFTTVYVVLGLAPVTLIPQLWMAPAVGPAPTILIACGGAAYIAGAVCFALRKPNPVPGWFEFHEVFHLGTVIGYACHVVAIYLIVCAL